MTKASAKALLSPQFRHLCPTGPHMRVFAPDLLLPSQDAQPFRAPMPPVAQLVLDIVEQHTLREPSTRYGDCSCGIYVPKGRWQRHINSVVHPAVRAYLAASQVLSDTPELPGIEPGVTDPQTARDLHKQSDEAGGRDLARPAETQQGVDAGHTDPEEAP